MTRVSKRSKLSKAGKIYAVVLAGSLLVTLVVAVYSLWPRLLPPRARVDLWRVLRPGAHDSRIPWANAQATAAILGLDQTVAVCDTLRDVEGFAIRVGLHPTVPLEEGNRLLSAALGRLGIDILDGYEEPAESGKRRLVLIYGLDGRPCGRVRMDASRLSPAREPGPVVALILDDVGFQPDSLIEAFLSLDFPFAAAVVPGYPNSTWAARRASECGRDVLLHMPMEPEGYPRTDPGEDAILVDLSESEIRERIERSLRRVPGAVGISNHMGSMATQDRRSMEAVMAVVRREGLFFVDSRTTSRSIVAKVAREGKVPCVRNDLFIDRDRSAEKIRGRLDQLVARARSTGSAVGIFHPHALCLEVIPKAVARYQADGVRFVRLCELGADRWIGGLPAHRPTDVALGPG